jgi:acetyl/propionyl-CoA carboxylase alpha subunit/acetyl-CoA carboxylase carboxyltransferase component
VSDSPRVRSIQRIAIANRGEAAMRCLRAVKSLRAREGSNLQAVALYTSVDRDTPFVRHADLAVELPHRSGAVAAYLDREGLVDAIVRAGADAVWPGWGFLAEDPAFVERVERAGIRFLGPSADTMRRLGDKISAKQLAEGAGVAVAAWSGREIDGVEAAERAAARIGFPLMVKASAGGGGRGIRFVGTAGELAAAVQSAGAEARAAFGDGRLFLERRIEQGRHLEVQIAGDLHGHVIALGCRDCSVQRRHQKVIEEAPPFGVPAELQREIEGAAIRLARSVGYSGVGTVEFLLAHGSYYFLEVNPRLQVEHGVTEAITGVDLVELQIRIGRGERIGGLEARERGVAIEARVCAEDPDREFQPAPGRVARFDPPLGAGVRVDTGVVAGSRVPPDFDSLIAKVIATGATRDEARARLAYELRDFELVVAGGATNKSFLIEVLESAEYRAGEIDTGWLDRRGRGPRSTAPFAVEALAVAAMLLYQDARRTARLNFFADPTNASAARAPSPAGQDIDLSYEGESYRIRALALGSWRYRLLLDGGAFIARLHEHGHHGARLVVGAREFRVLHDVTDAAVRVEVEGAAHRFARQAAGTVTAGSPAVVVAVHVEAGDVVTAGQTLGVLEAMKMEIAFRSPLPGRVVEVKVRKGQQVAAGEPLLVVEPQAADPAGETGRERLAFRSGSPDEALDLVFSDGGADGRAAAYAGEARERLLEELRADVRGLFLGYDCDPDRALKVVAFLESAVEEGAIAELRAGMTAMCGELTVFADIERLFLRTPRPAPSGEIGPSNESQLRAYLRRMRAGGTGVAEGFLALVERALGHYGVVGLAHDDALERALLRLFASQREGALRHRAAGALIRLAVALAPSQPALREDAELREALLRISRLRGLVPDALADQAIEAGDEIFEAPEIERRNAQAWQSIQSRLTDDANGGFTVPPEALLSFASAPWTVFQRVGSWIAETDERYRSLGVLAHLCRWYAPAAAPSLATEFVAGVALHRVNFPDGRTVVAAVLAGDRSAEATARIAEAAGVGSLAVELLVPEGDGAAADVPVGFSTAALAGRTTIERVTVSSRTATGHLRHVTFARDGEGAILPRTDLHGIHPEVATRIGLDRLASFRLERLEGSEGIYAFHGRSREAAGDERVFVLGEARGVAGADDTGVEQHVGAFVQAFHEAVSTLRSALLSCDPARRLRWNRITLAVAPEIFLDPATVQSIARRLAPSTRHLGLDKIVVRLNLRDEAHGASRPVEIVFTDSTGALEASWREPHRDPLRPAGDYERRVAEARRRGLAYPYEIIRMLTAPAADSGADFDEHDLGVNGQNRVVSVRGRPYGGNVCGIVFGIISTPTDKVPEGMRRVLVLSDSTRDLGALGAAECDRIVAAIDLAERLSLPVEWVPVSSGARIAMDSGTENLDATARVVRRIVTFTQRGGSIHVIVQGVNVGAQSYFDALATMLPHTRGALIMTRGGAMVLTGKAALEASGSVAGEDEAAIGGLERIMAPNGEAQYYAADLADAYAILYEHYRYTYVVPGEAGPRLHRTSDAATRSLVDFPCVAEPDHEFRVVGEIFDAATNPGRRRPFSMRALMAALVDWDGGRLERWRSMVGGETAIVWDAHLGGHALCMIGIESRNVPREGHRPPDGPSVWNGGTLFPLSSKKVARALNAASGNRPVVVLANLSGFDGSPESMRNLQLEYGAEIARAVVNFSGPLLFAVVSRYHGGAYVVFSRALNPALRALALQGSFASVIGGAPAAAVVFAREVRARAERDERVTRARRAFHDEPGAVSRQALEQALEAAVADQRSRMAAEFDEIHTVERARRVGSLEQIVPPAELRSVLIGLLDDRRLRVDAAELAAEDRGSP